MDGEKSLEIPYENSSKGQNDIRQRVNQPRPRDIELSAMDGHNVSQNYLTRSALNHNNIQIGMEVEQNELNQLPKVHTFGEPPMREFNPYGDGTNSKMAQFTNQKHLLSPQQMQGGSYPIDPQSQPQEAEEDLQAQKRSQKIKERCYMVVVFLIILGLGLYVGGIF